MGCWRRIYERLLIGRSSTMAAARRCSRCGIDWPDAWDEYGKCPGCEERTDRIMDAKPLGTAEALSRRNHYAFEAFYQRREDARVAALEAIPTKK